MKLAILVVYYFTKETAGLIDIHLDYIRRNTSCDYTIYGTTTLLGEWEKAHLAQHDDVVKVEAPPAPPGSIVAEEHTHHLNVLREKARASNATHFVSLHADSFPILPDWVDVICRELECGASFACTTPMAYTGCLFWPRALEEGSPPLRLTDEEASSFDFARFREAHTDYDHGDSGIAFLYHAWRDGRRWYELPLKSPCLWGGVILHIQGTARFVVGRDPAKVEAARSRFGRLHRPRLAWLPGWLRKLLQNIKASAGYQRKPTDREQRRKTETLKKKAQIEALIRDPDAFVERVLAASVEDASPAAPSR